ncbi:MAG: hypothetical protein AB7F59_04605 [Bdellovibrionales bacterium]
MENRSDIVIVSAYGRGIWLAQQLARLGHSVAYLDTSDKIGKWNAEDWEGPFGLFKKETLDETQWAHWSLMGEVKEIPPGYTFWLPSGPLEFRGPLFDFTASRTGLKPELIEYLKNFDTLELSHQHALKRFIEKSHTDGVWPALFAHQIASSYYNMDRHRLISEKPLSLFAPFYVRKVGQQLPQISQHLGKDKKIKYFPKARIEDLSLQGRSLDAIEVASEQSGVVRGRYFVWMVTSEETKNFSERVQTKLYPKGVLASSWCWLRYELEFPDGPESDVLPDYFVLVKDMHLPWTHANVCLVKRSENRKKFFAWIRVAAARRFQRSYLHEMGELILQQLKERLPALQVTITGMPAEHTHTLEELGAPKWPVYQTSSNAFQKTQIKNLYYGSFEDSSTLHRNEQYDLQKKLLETIVRAETELKKKTEVKRDSEIHPS